MTEQRHDWYIDLAPAFALGAADEDEGRALEQHLETCPECRELVAGYRLMSEDLLYAAPLMAAPVGLTEDLRRRLNAPAAQLQRFRQPALPDRRPGWLDFLRRPAFALGAVIVLLVFTNLYWAGRMGRLERAASEFAALARAPGVALYTSDNRQYANGVVYFQPGSRVALLCVYALPELEKGKTYQAWLIRDGQRESAGTFNVSANGYGVLLIQPGGPVSGYQQLGVTVEPAGGSPSPTTPRVIGGEL